MDKLGTVQFMFGPEGIKKAYEMTLSAKTLAIVCLSQNYQKIVGVYFAENYAPRLYGSEVQTREVLPDSKGNRQDAKEKDGRKNQVRFISESVKSESDYMLFDDTAVLVSYNPEMPYALVLRDREIVLNLKSQFDAMWNGLAQI